MAAWLGMETRRPANIWKRGACRVVGGGQGCGLCGARGEPMKTLRIDAPNGAIAFREFGGKGPAAVLIHGNSSSSRVFSRQLDGPLGERFRLVAVDLPGHGASDDARDPSAYSLPGHARAVRAVVDALQLGGAVFVGWSLGGHVALEMAPELTDARGFMIFGTPPLAFPPADGRRRSCPTRRWASSSANISTASRRPPMSARFSSRVSPTFRRSSWKTRCERTGARAAVSGQASRPAAIATRSRWCAILEFRSPCCMAPTSSSSTAAISRPFAMPTLWRGAVQVIPGAGHTPHWETPEAFDALLAAFVDETA